MPILCFINADFPPQSASITDEGDPAAGSSNYILVCFIERRDLSNSSTLAIQWLDHHGNELINGANSTISDFGPTNDSVLTSKLKFNNLFTSQAGNYTCKSLLTIPGTVTNYPYLVTFTVKVKCEYPFSHTQHYVRS